MNNLEKLLENKEELEVLCDFFDLVPSCGSCLAKDFCRSDDGMLCIETRARWLLEEYVESDSWEKIEADAKKDAYDYWKCRHELCSRCPAVFDGSITPLTYYGVDDCHKAQGCDLVARVKKLAGVEQ